MLFGLLDFKVKFLRRNELIGKETACGIFEKN